MGQQRGTKTSPPRMAYVGSQSKPEARGMWCGSGASTVENSRGSPARRMLKRVDSPQRLHVMR